MNANKLSLNKTERILSSRMETCLINAKTNAAKVILLRTALEVQQWLIILKAYNRNYS
jgi:hypothetical protein